MDRRTLPALILGGTLLLAIISHPGSAPATVTAAPADTQVVSVPDNGDPAAAVPAEAPAVSGDGRYVAFESRQSLDPVVEPGPVSNIYVRDRRSPGHTVLISRGLPQTSFAVARGRSVPMRQRASYEVGGNRDSLRPTISADGRYVAFDSDATNLQDGFPAFGYRRVILCDRDPDGDGVFDELRPDESMDYAYLYLSVEPVAGRAPEGSAASLSGDGATIAWKELGDDREWSAVVIARLTKDAAGRPFQPDPALFLRPVQNALGTMDAPQVSADGRHVAFSVGLCESGCVPSSVVRVYDVAAGRTDQLPSSGALPVISGTGRIVAFEQRDDDGVRVEVVDRDPDGNGDLGPGGGEPVSSSVASRDVDGRAQDGSAPALSADGRYVAFESSADGMHSDVQGTGRTAIVLRDLVGDAEREQAGLPRLPGELGSPRAEPGCAVPSLLVPRSGDQARDDELACPADGPSRQPRLSGDGAVVTFVSAGYDLLTDPCCAGAVFARSFRPGVHADPVDFGPVAVGNSVRRTVVLRHAGFGPVRLGSVTASGAPDFTVSDAENCVGAVLHQTGTCVVGVDFAPTAAGRREAVLRIGLPDGRTAETTLVGDVTPPTTPGEPPVDPPAPTGGLVVTPDPLVFAGAKAALVVNGPRTVQLRNASTTTITVARTAILQGPRFTLGDFAIGRNTCQATVLAPDETCSLDVSATPQAAGRRDGVLSVETTDTAYSRLVSLRSEAAQPVLLANPAVARPNRVVSLTGRDFPPGRAVTIALTTPGSRTLLTANIKPDGTFTAAVLVFPQTSAGTWPITATVASVNGTVVEARTPVLVVPGSYQPPGFTSRR